MILLYIIGSILFTFATNIFGLIIVIFAYYIFKLLILEKPDFELPEIRYPLTKFTIFITLYLFYYFEFILDKNRDYYHLIAIVSILSQAFVIYKAHKLDEKQKNEQ